MADHEWNFAKAGSACCVCHAAFAPEQRYFSALIQNPEAMARQDYCMGCFEAKRPENIFYFWKAAQPGAEGENLKQRPRIDVEYVFEFFKRLDAGGTGSDNTAPQRVAFRYILALMLARKKVLIFEGKKKDAAGNDVHIYREKRGGEMHPVVEPSLSEEEIASVSAELGVLLGLTPPAPKTPAQGESGAPEEGSAVVTGAESENQVRRTTE